MQRILVATDLSERSDRAIERAISMAKESGAPLTILHVIDDDLPSSVADKLKHAAETSLREYVASIANAKGLDINLVVDFGKNWTEILRRANADQSALIIIGLHRERGLEGLFRGTTVERVIRNGELPVLVVKNRSTESYRNIVVGVDFSVYSRRAVEFALNFAPTANVHLVHAYDIPFRAFLTGPNTHAEIRKREEEQFTQMIEQEMAGFLSGLETSLTRINRVMQEGRPHHVLHAQVEKLDADLLVLGTHGRTGVAHAFLGSVAEGLLNDPPCDVVAVKVW